MTPSSVFLAKKQLASDGSEVVQPVVIPVLKPSLDDSMSKDMTLCPVRAFRYYRHKTKDLRENSLSSKGFQRYSKIHHLLMVKADCYITM